MTHRWLVAALAIVLAVGPIANPAAAELKIATKKGGPFEELVLIVLRPNTEKSFFLVFHNHTGTTKLNVKIELDELMPDGTFRKIGEKLLPKVDGRNSAPIAFDFPVPAAKGKDGPAWPKLAGPPFKVRFRVTEDGQEKIKQEVPVLILRPSEYINPPVGSYDPTTRRLTFSVSSKDKQLLEPDCPIELIVNPTTIPGLIPNEVGTSRRTLNKDVTEVELSAGNIEFDGGVPPPNGRVYVNVDGYERAFAYKCTFAKGQLPALNSNDIRLRLLAPRYSAPAKEVSVIVETDAKSREDGSDQLQETNIHVGFDESNVGNFAARPLLRGLRDQTVEYKSDGDALVFKTTVKDHVVALPIGGIKGGQRQARAQVKDAKGIVLEIADESNVPGEKLNLFSQGSENKLAPLNFAKNDKAIVANLVIDGTPADDVKIEGLPAKARTEDKLTPVIKFKSRDPLSQAPIEEVFFFFGEADASNKLPENVKKIPATFSPEKNGYHPKDPDEMIVPADAKSRTYVSAYVKTTTGGVATKKQAIIALPKGAKEDSVPDVLTTILGVVIRGELRQPGVVVTLAKAKPTKDDVPKKATAGKDGSFEFKNVEPGNYVISAFRQDSGVARETLTIEKNEEKKKVTLKLLTP